jgi:hypothetical protein
MNLLSSYLLAFYALSLGFDPGYQSPPTDLAQPGEWLLFETLDLQLRGPCYDVAFFQDDIIFLKSGEESLYLAPMLRPDPSFSRPLFANRDLSCSPAALSFSSDYDRGYYTRPVLGSEQVYMEKIFEMSITEDRVSGIRQLPFSEDPSRNLHPTISSDGSIMVFSSDRLPTNGGLDLYVTRWTTEGWTLPVNMGESINSSGHEWFPFLDRMNNLWFSSTGHSGYGGFDIYICPFNGAEWGLPRNLGASINGPQNELGFSVHAQKQVALFSRTWPSEKRGLATMITLNEEALDDAGIDEAAARDIIMIIQGMADPASQSITAVQNETENTGESETIIEVETESDPVYEEEVPVAANSQDQVIFRIQIISSLYENSFPTVLIDGQSYKTYEYNYMGSYRITVGEFTKLEDANAFRLRCLDSGFKQAFVAAFRGGERVTDPSVFK